MLLVIDNYDSFVHNLARYLRRLGQETRVVRNDVVTPAMIERLAPDAIVLSPGPGTPEDAGRSVQVVRYFAERFPMLGVCLGHQTIAAAFGGRIVRAAEPMHGRSSRVVHDGTSIFAGLPNPLRVGRYHSLVVDPATLPKCFRPLAHTNDGVLMAFEHVQRPVVGVQFHPESVLTESGHALLAGFLHRAGLTASMPSVGDESPAWPPVETPRRWPDEPITF
ncbi:MAG TPA: aminodeoxychorismate/anthranilate synthase component II [Gemmatimonadaceae bacterium]